MVVMMLLSTNKRVMGKFTTTIIHRVVGWLATVVMLSSAVAIFSYWGK